ncbi:MAG: signal peptide peptidase SppA [Helicobacteraceae bacterium]|nr:signal peptide peptidase SppA [Helicobacteraceae bacterium]
MSFIVSILSFIKEHFKALLFIAIIYWMFAPTSSEDLRPHNLQHINITGAIMQSDEIVEKLEKARTDNNIEGVLVTINSPGGAVAPSIEIAYAIKRLQKKKKVVVYGSSLLASGGYYSAIWADKIVANPGSMIGSIGVIIQGFNAGELMSKIGVKTQVIKAGKYKQMGTADREWTLYEREELSKIVDGTYDLFIVDVAKARNLKIEDASKFANAKIFIASQAKDVGLIDTIGVEYDAKLLVQKLSGVQEPIWNSEDKFDKILNKLTAQSISLIHTYFPAVTLK